LAESLLAEFPVVIEQAVLWGEMDAYRHVNNVVYFRYFENARIEYFRRLDWIQFEKDTGIGPILAATSAKFRKPLTFPDTIQIGARVIELREDRFALEHHIVSQRLGTLVTEGHGVVVSYLHGEHKKVPLPDEIRSRITALEATAGRTVA
jgi:acyl-CoA thioester hydrolase